MQQLARVFLVVFLIVGTTRCVGSVPLAPKALTLNHDGVVALEAGDLELAEARFAVAVEYNPRFTEAWVNLGTVELFRGNLVLARRHFEKARGLNADLPAPHHALGLLCDKSGLFVEAEAHYRAALKVDPGFALARANLGRRLFARGAYDDAREQFLRLTQVAGASVEGWVGLTESLLRLGRVQEADAALDRAHARFGDAPAVVLLVARRALREGHAEEAEGLLTPLTGDADRSRRGTAWAWFAVSRLAQKDRAGAERAAALALEVDPSDPVAVYALRLAAQ